MSERPNNGMKLTRSVVRPCDGRRDSKLRAAPAEGASIRMRTIVTAVLLLVAAMSAVRAEDGDASAEAPPRFTMLRGRAPVVSARDLRVGLHVEGATQEAVVATGGPTKGVRGRALAGPTGS